MTTSKNDRADGRLTLDRLHAALASVQETYGLDASDAELIKFTNNAVFRLPHAGKVVRIAGSQTMRSRIDKVIRVSRWLELHDVPAVRLLETLDQPVNLNGLPATVWHEILPNGAPPTGRDLATILRRLHAIASPAAFLPTWAPFKAIRQRLDESDGVDQADIEFLHDQCSRIEDELERVSFALPSGPIHGDAFMGNLIAGAAGTAICDFDSACLGPREWDLTPVAVGKLRFDYPGDTYGELVSEYGFDVTLWPGFPTLRKIRELQLVSSVVPVLGGNPPLRDQWQYRLDTFRNRQESARWSTYH